MSSVWEPALLTLSCLLVNSVTPSEYCGIAPMNQASCAVWVVPVLAITVRPGQAASG